MSLIARWDEELRLVKFEWHEAMSEALLADSYLNLDDLSTFMADRFKYEIRLAIRRAINRLREGRGWSPL